MRTTKYKEEILAPALRESRSFADLLRRLGLKPTGGNHRLITARIRQAGLDTSHLGHMTITRRCRAIPVDTLAQLVQESSSVGQLLAKLQMPPAGRAHHELSQRLRDLQLDTSHFLGEGWARGQTKLSHPSIARAAARARRSDEEVFVENSPVHGGIRLVPRLTRLGWPYRCAWCGLTEWRDQKLVLHVDHINGINNDNRLSNLRFLCPNCHSQTNTYCNRSRAHDCVV